MLIERLPMGRYQYSGDDPHRTREWLVHWAPRPNDALILRATGCWHLPAPETVWLDYYESDRYWRYGGGPYTSVFRHLPLSPAEFPHNGDRIDLAEAAFDAENLTSIYASVESAFGHRPYSFYINDTWLLPVTQEPDILSVFSAKHRTRYRKELRDHADQRSWRQGIPRNERHRQTMRKVMQFYSERYGIDHLLANDEWMLDYVDGFDRFEMLIEKMPSNWRFYDLAVQVGEAYVARAMLICVDGMKHAMLPLMWLQRDTPAALTRLMVWIHMTAQFHECSHVHLYSTCDGWKQLWKAERQRVLSLTTG